MAKPHVEEKAEKKTKKFKILKSPSGVKNPMRIKVTKKITAYKGGGIAGMRRFNRGGKV